MKHIQTPPECKQLLTANPQTNDNEAWEQLGIPLARVLSGCAEAMWRQQLIAESERINARTDLGVEEKLRLVIAATIGGEK
jgi:hypothetical protein